MRIIHGSLQRGCCAAVLALSAFGHTVVVPSAATAQGITQPSRTIAEALSQPTDLVADHKPLVQVVIELQQRHSIPLLFDNEIVPGSAAYGDPTVTCDFHRLPLRRVLHEILDSVDMDYVIHNNSVLIVTREKARALKRWPKGSAKSVNEAKIAAALDEPTEIDFHEQPLEDVLDYLRDKHKIDIQLDGGARKDERAVGETPISRTVSGITLESALDLMLRDLDLTWSIRDEVLLISSKAGANKLIETRVYPVFDLVMAPPGSLPDVDGPDYDPLIEVLSEAAAVEDPAAAPVRVYRPAGAIIVTRPVATHRRIEKLLADLRRAKYAQSGAE